MDGCAQYILAKNNSSCKKSSLSDAKGERRAEVNSAKGKRVNGPEKKFCEKEAQEVPGAFSFRKLYCTKSNASLFASKNMENILANPSLLNLLNKSHSHTAAIGPLLEQIKVIIQKHKISRSRGRVG